VKFLQAEVYSSQQIFQLNFEGTDVQKIGIMSDDRMMNTRFCGMENGQHLSPEI
jgi:hypothetical protein